MNAPPLASSLRLSLLASLGLLPLACGGAFRAGDEDAGGSGGTMASAGTDAGGTTTGGTGTGAAPMTAGNAGVAGTVSTPFVPTCTAPVTDPTSGVVTCKEGYTHRPRPSRCETTAGAPAPPVDPKPRATGYVECAADPSVCDQFLYGYCAMLAPPGGGSICQTGCMMDSDCGPGGMCRCEGGAVGTCTFDACDSDADCGPGYLCASYPGVCGPAAFACQTPRDTCGECGPNELCEIQADDHRACAPVTAVCGRPFLVLAEPRVAPLATRLDWLKEGLAEPRVDHLTAEERAAQAGHWTKLGQMEHASIAAFARFQLQLLALGAPADLVRACNQALVDETAHTQLCFGLASAYAGRAIGPGPLDVLRSLEVTSLTDVVDLVVAEGCFGETSAALDALEAAETAADPAIRDAYARIAADEQRHAELAFQFVRWALERGGQVVRERVRSAVATPPSSSLGARAVAVPCLQALIGAQRLAIAREPGTPA